MSRIVSIAAPYHVDYHLMSPILNRRFLFFLIFMESCESSNKIWIELYLLDLCVLYLLPEMATGHVWIDAIEMVCANRRKLQVQQQRVVCLNCDKGEHNGL